MVPDDLRQRRLKVIKEHMDTEVNQEPGSGPCSGRPCLIPLSPAASREPSSTWSCRTRLLTTPGPGRPTRPNCLR